MAWPITADLRDALNQLFPVRRDRVVVLGLVALAAVVSTTELLATQLFSALILPADDRSTATTVLLVIGFFAMFGGLRVVHYGREMYRVNVFERALVEATGPARARDSWRWAMAMEVTTFLSAAARCAVVVAACVALAPLFGVAVIVVVAIIGKALSMVFTRQLGTQRSFRAMQLAKTPVSHATKLRTRVRAGESGALVGYLGVVLLIGLLLLLTLADSVSPGTAFVVFVALRMLGQILGEIAKSLMRFVRARAFSE